MNELFSPAGLASQVLFPLITGKKLCKILPGKYFDKLLVQMVTQNDLYCSTIISFTALALFELKGYGNQFLIKGLWV